MAEIEDVPYKPEPQYASSLMNFDSGTILAIIMQCGSGIAALYYALPGFITLVLLLPYAPSIPISTQTFLIVWGILPIIGVIQLLFGYNLFKKKPGSIRRAITINILALILFGVDVAVSAFENILFAYPEVLGYFGLNILIIFILNMTSIRNQLDPQVKTNTSQYPQY